jgi:hypothetical protein
MAEPGGAIYWLFAAIVLAFLAGIGNAWMLLVEVVRDERYRPVPTPTALEAALGRHAARLRVG